MLFRNIVRNEFVRNIVRNIVRNVRTTVRNDARTSSGRLPELPEPLFPQGFQDFHYYFQRDLTSPASQAPESRNSNGILRFPLLFPSRLLLIQLGSFGTSCFRKCSERSEHVRNVRNNVREQHRPAAPTGMTMCFRAIIPPIFYYYWFCCSFGSSP